MRLLVVMGVMLLGVLGAAFMLNQSPEVSASMQPASTMTPLEVTLGRPFVLYVDGALGTDFRQTLMALDSGRAALAAQAAPRTLIDLDVYVMVRPDWDTFRTIEGHDLAPLIRDHAQDKADDAGIAWFEAALTAADGTQQNLLVLLATEAARVRIGEFCFAVTVYDLARYARNGVQFTQASDGPGAHWKQCRAQGWRSIADLSQPF